MTRNYIPNIDDRVKLKDIAYHTQFKISLWAWLKVLETTPITAKVEILNGNKPTGETRVVLMQAIQPPLGWEPVYTITCKDIEQAKTVHEDWFKRGIHVWASHDLSSAGRMAYTPVVVENMQPVVMQDQSPHWQYTGNPVETIKPADCEKCFRIEVLHEWEPELPPTSQRTARDKAVKEIRAQPGVTLDFIRVEGNYTMPLCQRVESAYEPKE